MNDIQNARRPHVVIVGAGFAGINAAKVLRKAPVDVTLIDRNNYHKFQPLLYQVATAGLEADEIAHSVRGLFRWQANIRFRLGTVRTIDRRRKTVYLMSGPPVPYDYLILAAGAVTNYYGVEGAAEYAFPLKSLPEAIRLRNHVIRRFEVSDRDPASAGEGALNFVLVGGGPTGVEMAGALVELFDMLRGDFPQFDVSKAQVFLLESQPDLLMAFAPALRRYTRRVLERRGVQVRTGTTVARVEPGAVYLASGERIPTQTLIWAAGVRAHPLADTLGTEQARGGRLVVEADLSVPGHPEIFAVGDMAAGRDEQGELYPQLAPVAMQQGAHAAKQILRRLRGEATKPFRYVNYGTMATIGRHAAVAEMPGQVRLKGYVAWLMWVFIHIARLVGFRNRANVFVNWIYNYFTYDRSARLILDMVPISDGVPHEVEVVEQHVQEKIDELAAMAA